MLEITIALIHMKKTIQPVLKSFGNWKRTRRYAVLARWNRSFKLSGVTLCSLALRNQRNGISGAGRRTGTERLWVPEIQIETR